MLRTGGLRPEGKAQFPLAAREQLLHWGRDPLAANQPDVKKEPDSFGAEAEAALRQSAETTRPATEADRPSSS